MNDNRSRQARAFEPRPTRIPPQDRRKRALLDAGWRVALDRWFPPGTDLDAINWYAIGIPGHSLGAAYAMHMLNQQVGSDGPEAA